MSFPYILTDRPATLAHQASIQDGIGFPDVDPPFVCHFLPCPLSPGTQPRAQPSPPHLPTLFCTSGPYSDTSTAP
eukprot:12914300-Prorocentrum_lima.AAC.1